MAIWRMTDAGPRRLPSSPLDLEQRLEDMLAEDPGMTGIDLLVVGRQVRTAYGGFIDLLALDADGRVHILELKRDRTPRDVVAQTLDYGSWVKGLGIEDLEQMFLDHHDGETDLEEAFAEQFASPLPDVVNADQQFTIIASELDPTSDRIVEFLAKSYGVPINAVFFRHFRDDDRDYLARTWLIDPERIEVPDGGRKTPRWNGRDFYTVLGRVEETHRWQVAIKYGLLNAGGGSWYWKPLRNLRPGHRVFAYVGGAGYVGIGQVTGEMIPAREAKVEINGDLQPLLDQPEPRAGWWEEAASEDPETTEMVVPVKWDGTRSLDDAVWEKGLFASQLSACILRDERTITTVVDAFGFSPGID
ncbi:MAG: endonuclease NucS [bacterium]|nr:endonuclease NucS [bacterium]